MMSLRRYSLVATALTCTALTTPAQTVVQVSGAPNALRIAAATASPGTVFVLQPGLYDSFQWTLPNATIVAQQRASLRGIFFVTAAANRLRMKNIDVLRGQQAGGSFVEPGSIWSNGATLVLDHCSAERLDAVDSTVIAASSSLGGFMAPTTLTNCDAVFTDSQLRGGSFNNIGCQRAGPGMQVVDSRVRIERSTIEGQISTYCSAAGNVIGDGLIVTGSSVVTVADSTLISKPAGQPFPFPQTSPAEAMSVATTAAVTVSNTTIIGVTSGPFATAQLATAAWRSAGPLPSLTPGTTLTARFSEQANTGVAVILSFDLAPFTTPLVAEQLFVFATANWIPLTNGISDAQGHLDVSFTLPNAPSLQFQDIWLTGLFGGSLPVRSTAPLGGVIF